MSSAELAKEAPPASGDKFDAAAADLVTIVDETAPPANPVTRYVPRCAHQLRLVAVVSSLFHLVWWRFGHVT